MVINISRFDKQTADTSTDNNVTHGMRADKAGEVCSTNTDECRNDDQNNADPNDDSCIICKQVDYCNSIQFR